MNKKIPTFYRGMDSEIRAAIKQIEKDRKAGKLKDPPARAGDCRTMEDLCRLIFKLAHLDGSYQMFGTKAGIKRWVWFGHDFNDRLINKVELILPKIIDANNLRELRLVATKVSKEGILRLCRLFPSAKVTVYTDTDDSKNWRLSQANFTPRRKLVR